MGIVDEDIARVRQATDLVALVSEHTQLRKVGSRWSGLCPFHSEKSPSFSVNQAEGLYYCFGCRVSGDAITFLRELEGLDFVEAVERLAAKAGIALNYTDRAESATRQKRKGLLSKVEEAVDFYHERLKTSPDASAARSYLRSRGFDAEEVARYRIGWAPDSWDVLCRSLRLDSETATATGLGFTNKAGRLQDFFRARVLFPIFDAEGHAVGFGGRIMPGEEGAKYKNSRDSDLYHKSRLLYGLNWARQAAVRNGRVVICEGYTDVIGFHRAGVPEAVATCGTSLTEDHLKLLSRYVDKVVLAFDADSAGQAAAERIYAWEKAFNLAVEVVRLPEGSDPDELSRSDPDALAAAVESAEPMLRFRLERVLGAAIADTPEARARRATTALGVVAEHPDPMVRDPYLLEVADRSRLDPSLLRNQLEDLRTLVVTGEAVSTSTAATTTTAKSIRPGDGDPGPRGPEADAFGDEPAIRTPPRPVGKVHTTEMAVLIHLASQPDGELAALPAELFTHPLARSVRSALVSAGSVAQAVAEADPESWEARLLSRLAVSEPDGTPEEAAHSLVARAGARAMEELEAELRQADRDEAGTSITSELLNLHAWVARRVDQLRDPETAEVSARALVAYLRGDEGEDQSGVDH
ncbi:MAG: DNA primase [Candidatus Microthrix subdominans]|jgi:DNA primase|uniref:DNA primase n=1 Tax=Candidatus Neomicrothrix sp. TaxID=2719034 RepID=UPI00257FC682|nr:DNA primase [Candidatus Microthrix sp.]MBK9558120.1 DNA primase [Candidatus Microthrix sp.]HMS46587.1 DNA primase [Candidatus Microthrix sp.]